VEKINEVVLKGTGNTDDGYSAFEGTNVDLSSWLRKNKVTDVYVCGIATEYCVLATATDAMKNGFRTTVITDAIAAVEAQPGDTEKALNAMKESGLHMANRKQI
ncbi:MAG TPA: isochorismatase family protein, partial [Ginsengibacter sp.]|nr:isochorismatase family protein [Ginsengibacter sp.]